MPLGCFSVLPPQWSCKACSSAGSWLGLHTIHAHGGDTQRLAAGAPAVSVIVHDTSRYSGVQEHHAEGTVEGGWDLKALRDLEISKKNCVYSLKKYNLTVWQYKWVWIRYATVQILSWETLSGCQASVFVFCACARVHVAMYLHHACIWFSRLYRLRCWQKHSTKQSITIAGCNFQLIGAQWCLSGLQQTETFVIILLAHLYVNLTFSTPFKNTHKSAVVLFGCQSFRFSRNISNSLFMKVMKAEHQNTESEQLLNDAMMICLLVIFCCRYHVGLCALGAMLVALSQQEVGDC